MRAAGRAVGNAAGRCGGDAKAVAIAARRGRGDGVWASVVTRSIVGLSTIEGLCLRGGLAEPEDGGGGVGGAAVAAQQQLPDRVLRARVPAGAREYYEY